MSDLFSLEPEFSEKTMGGDPETGPVEEESKAERSETLEGEQKSYNSSLVKRSDSGY